MSNNTFSWKRFQLLFKQHLIHNTQFLLLSMVAYMGVIFIVLSLSQVANDFLPHELESFQGFLIGFVSVFGILYVGHAFPAFRSKESTIGYLMTPASALEKFLFEFVSRIGLILVILPLLFWVTFNLQGYVFGMFSEEESFSAIGIYKLVEVPAPDSYKLLIYSLIIGGVLMVLSLAFVGASMFTKQPLVKTLFAIAVLVAFFFGYSYVVVTQFDLEDYTPPAEMFLVPTKEDAVLKLLCFGFFAVSAVMLFVAYRKLKEREV